MSVEREPSEIVAEIYRLEQSNQPMYFFVLELLIEHLLTTVRNINKKDEENGKKGKHK